MNKLILYTFRRCPYAMRARMALQFAKINYELREVDLKDKPAALIDVSPKATVPVLIVNEKEVIDESLDIITWVSEQTKQPLTESINQNEWVLNLSTQFVPCLHRYKYPERFEDIDFDTNINELNAYLSAWDQHLQTRQSNNTFVEPWLEIAIFPLIRQLWIIDDGWTHGQYSHLSRWITNILTSDQFAKIMHKYPKWSPQDKPVHITNDQ